jgi:hypothetical protein
MASNTFGDGDDSHAHWFKPERFMEPDFNAEKYVADVRRYVS